MKRLLFTLLIVLAMAATAHANPFLTCDDMAGVDSYILELDGVDQPASPAVAGHAWIDMAPLAMGAHTVRLKAQNIWGVGPYSAPLGFTKQLPGAPSGVGLRAN
jgi:hypothetical protein